MKFKHIRFDPSAPIPALLYHGAIGEYSSLMSGFSRTGELVKWDETESNQYLYATSSREEAISQGFASIVEKHWRLARYRTKGREIEISVEAGTTLPTLSQLRNLVICLYTIKTYPEHAWVKNTNEFNGLDTEYKTEKNIYADDFTLEKVSAAPWLDRHHIVIRVNPQSVKSNSR
jgi:hypothetical protein